MPCEIASAVIARGGAVHIVGLEGEAEGDIENFPHTWVNWGGIGAMLRAFKSAGCRDLVIVGRVRRPNLRAIRPDLGFWTSLPVLLQFLRGGDDAILRLVVGFFERHGLRVIGVHEAAPELIAPAGVLGLHAPQQRHLEAIVRGSQALAALGPFDAAQAAVADHDGLIAVEGADGTDAMLRRLADPIGGRGRSAGAGSGVLVKLPKPDQERRIDLPAIGPDTMRRAAEAGLAGVAVLTGQTLFAERKRSLELADEMGLFVTGIEQGVQRQPIAGSTDREELEGLRSLAQRAPSGAQFGDAALGARVLKALEPLWPQASCAVSRNYVLAIDGPRGALGVAERSGRLKPWGMRFLRRRSGVLVMTDITGELGYDPSEIVRRARTSGLAGIVILHSPRDEAALAALRSEADLKKLFVLAPGDVR